MKIKLRYPIRRGKSGFKSCVSHYAFVAEQLVKDHETEIDENDLNKLDDYIVSLKLMEIYNKFEARLTEEQKDAINYFRYHNPDESKPINYEENIKCAYQKWLHTFFDERNQSRVLKRINCVFLGRVMKRIRNKSNLTKVVLCELLGMIPKTIDRYEAGKSEPTLAYIVSFCSLFDISIDELLEHAIF